MNDIDFAPTTNGGRVRLSTIAKVDRPAQGADGWNLFVVSGAGSGSLIGPFSSEATAKRFMETRFPSMELL